MARERARADEVVRITTAAADHRADIASRQRKYLISMSIRSLCFIGAIISFLAGVTWLWPFLIAGALVLPYLAVVLANVQTTRSDGFELRQGVGARELGAAPPRPTHEAR